MIQLQRSICTLVAAGVLMSPWAHAIAQSTVNKTCLSVSDLPRDADVRVRFPSTGTWQSVDASTPTVVLSSPNDSSVEVWVWKQLPATEAQRTAANARTYNVNLTPSSAGGMCFPSNANYRVAMGDDGYILAYGYAANPASTQSTAPSTSTAAKSGGPSAGAIVGGILVLGLLAALMGGSSSKSSSSSSSSSNDEGQRIFERQREQERQRQEAAERAARERANDEFQRRLQTPNSLGW